jgi:predicted permease
MDSGFNAIAPGYFAALDIPLVAGRDFEAQDDDAAPPVAIINEELANRAFPGVKDPVGMRLYRDRDEPPHVVIGVVPTVRAYDLEEDPQPMIYVSVLQRPTPSPRFLVRSELGTGALQRPLREALASIDPEVALGGSTTLEEIVGTKLGRYRTAATLVGLFATLALILASVGLYGALSYLVVQRTREIGIRVAIGANPREVARAVLGRGLAVATSGLVVGLLAAMWASHALESLLFGLDPLDPLTFAAAPVVLLVIAAISSLLPARRAARIDPIRAIRVD